MIDIYNKKTMEFGMLKSKIERKLLESYTKNTFKQEVKNFKNIVLKNKNMGKLFYLYDELSSNKGLNESMVDGFIFECITIFENTLNKIEPKEFREILFWVGDVETENKYSDIDNLFSTDVLTIETKLKSKKIIAEQLKKEPQKNKETINIPLSTSVKIANKTISEHLNNLSEEEKKEILSLVSTSDEKLQEEFQNLKKNMVEKLTTLKESSDDEVKQKIEETITKVMNENYDKLNYYKMKVLFESI